LIDLAAADLAARLTWVAEHCERVEVQLSAWCSPERH
jgi:hypothetical protein